MKYLLYIIFLVMGSQLLAQSEWRDSIKVARKAYNNKEYSKALKYYQSAQKIAPEDVDLSDEIGQSAYKAREFEQAEKIYQQSAASKKSKIDKSKTYHNMGNSRMQKKDYAGAIDSYKEALRNNPKDEETRYNLSEAIRRLKDEQKKNNPNEDKNDPSKNNNSPQDPKDQKDKSGNKPKDEQGNNKDNKGGNESKDQQGKGNPSKLPNKTVERMLDQLMKEEAATKRKMGGSKDNNDAVKSGKDW